METRDCANSTIFRPAAPSATRSAAAALGTGDSDLFDGAAMDLEKVARGVKLILEGIGEDPYREGLLDTPSRVARMYRELLYGTGVDPASEITCRFSENVDDLVVVRAIPFASVCEHHLVPFIGQAHIAYIPADGRITGLSKLARVVELAARRLQVQERMTNQVADALETQLRPMAVAVVLEAEHFCMSIRGVRKPGSLTLTTAVRGLFKTDRAARAEVMSFLSREQGK